MHSNVIGKVCWIITALASINIGLSAMGYDIFMSEFVLMNLANLIQPMQYVIGLAGVVSLFMMVSCCMKSHKACDGKSCSRCGSMTGCNCK